jgi:hypothetical protein
LSSRLLKRSVLETINRAVNSLAHLRCNGSAFARIGTRMFYTVRMPKRVIWEAFEVKERLASETLPNGESSGKSNIF